MIYCQYYNNNNHHALVPKDILKKKKKNNKKNNKKKKKKEGKIPCKNDSIDCMYLNSDLSLQETTCYQLLLGRDREHSNLKQMMKKI